MPKYRLAHLLLLLLILPLCLPVWAASTQPMLPSQTRADNIPLLPYLDYFLDESGGMDIEEAASPELADAYRPFSLERMPATSGILWLRFTVAPIPRQERAPVFVLDIGPCAPGVPMLYEPEKNELSGALEWREVSPGNRNAVLLPEAGAEPVPCYLRLEGLPGIWFSPIVRTPQNAASNWDSLARSGAILALAVVMALCVLRGLSERGQWRFWTALYVFFALVQAVAGMPSQVGNPGLWGLCAILSPGLALMLLPHVGRHLLKTRQNSRQLDIQLFMLSLPGAVLALMPLLPGWSWLDRWLDLWPLATIIFVPTALAAWLMGLPGSRRFLLACLLPPLFTGIGILGLYFGVPANLLASAPLWGVALCALLLATTKSPEYAADDLNENGEPNANQPLLPLAPDNGGGDMSADGIITLDRPLAEAGPQTDFGPGTLDFGGNNSFPDDPNLRLIPAESIPSPTLEAAAEAAADAPAASGNKSGPKPGGNAPATFNLRRLLQETRDAVAPEAEKAGIGLSWYMAPQMAQIYQGSCDNLRDVLQVLLASSVRATRGGSAHLSARPVADSPDPGDILFVVTDSGGGFPPEGRSGAALDRAWQLVGEHNGHIQMEFGSQGATISFSLHFTPLDGRERALPRVAILCEHSARRQELVQMLAPLPILPCAFAEPEDLLRRQKEAPCGVLVVSGRMASPAAASVLRAFVQMARQAGFGKCKIMAAHSDNRQDKLLAASGFTHAIPEQMDAAELRSTVLELVEEVEAHHTSVEDGPDIAPIGNKVLDHQDIGRDRANQDAARDAGAEVPREQSVTEASSESAFEAVPQSPAKAEKGAEAVKEVENVEEAEEERKAPESGEAVTEAAVAKEIEDFLSAAAEEEFSEQAKLDDIPDDWEIAANLPKMDEIPEASPVIPTPQNVGETAVAPRAEIAVPPEAVREAADFGPLPMEKPIAVPEDAPELYGMGADTDESLQQDGLPVRETTRISQMPSSETVVQAQPEKPLDMAAGDSGTAAQEASKADEWVGEPQAVPHEPRKSGEWVGEPQAVEREPRKSDEWVGEPQAVPHEPRKSGEWVGEPQAVEREPRKSDEWVGEPQAVAREPRKSDEWVGEPQDVPREPRKADEWVGEPQAVAREPRKSGEWVGEPQAVPREPRKSDEWVGEPRPIRVQAGAGQSPPVRPAPKSTGTTRLENGAEPGSPLANFMQSTISQVTATLENLRKPGRPEQFADKGISRGAEAKPAAAPEPWRESGAEPPTSRPKVDSAIVTLVENLDRALAEAKRSLARGKPLEVAEACAKIAEESQTVGLRHLAKLARNVERAGRNKDIGVLNDFLPELELAIERNKIILTQTK